MIISFGRDGSLIGEYDETRVPGLIQTKVILPTDIYWHAGMPEWLPVNTKWIVPEEEGPTSGDLWYSRRMGLLSLGCGLALSWLCVLKPLREAQNQAESVSLSLKGTVLIPFCYCIGLIYLFAPRFALRVIGLPEDRKTQMYGLTAILLVIGCLLHWFIKQRLIADGYVF